MKAIILAGGLGTRLRPLTENTPKPLLPIKGIPIIEHAIKNFARHNITDIILSIGYKAELIQEYFKDGSKWGVQISYAIENEPLGTGGAIREAAKNINDTFVVINGDNLADFDWTNSIAAHRRNGAEITLSLFPVEDVTQFGIARLDNDVIVEFVEKPKKEEAPSNLNNAGGYVMEPGALAVLPPGFCSIERDCFEKVAPLKKVFAFRHDGQWYPTDTLEKYGHADLNYIPLSDV